MLLSDIKKDYLEKIYNLYNSKRYLLTDPIIFPSRFSKKADIEIASLISSSLSYGKVEQILKTLQKVFSILSSPLEYLKSSSTKKIIKDFKDIKHRFTTSYELASFLIRLKELYTHNKDMEEAFLRFYSPKKRINHSYTPFLLKTFGCNFKTLIPDPRKKSAMKRFNMFLRWMVRKDNIDFGIWKRISTSLLIYPLDTHIHRFALLNKITKRKDNSIKTAYEITDFFSKIEPQDPVKYDFAITRLGILQRLDVI